MTNGHNSVDKTALKSFVDRIELLEADKAILTHDIKEVYAEAKEAEIDTKILRKVIALRKKDKAEREAEQETLEMYLEALGELSDTPLGQAAVREAGLSA